MSGSRECRCQMERTRGTGAEGTEGCSYLGGMRDRPVGRYAAVMAEPNRETADAAVDALRAQLGIVIAALDTIDRKAALVPTVMGALAGVLFVSTGPYTSWQGALLLGALVTGVISAGLSLRVIWAQDQRIGPNAQEVAANTHLSPEHFHRAAAKSYADSIDALSALTEWKAAWLNRAMALAVATILLLALARFAGGITMPEDQGTQQQPTAAPVTAPASSTPPPSDGAAPPATQASPQAEVPTDFGQQTVIKSAVPSEVEIRIAEIDKRG